jgi:hypothetical protein
MGNEESESLELLQNERFSLAHIESFMLSKEKITFRPTIHTHWVWVSNLLLRKRTISQKVAIIIYVIL